MARNGSGHVPAHAGIVTESIETIGMSKCVGGGAALLSATRDLDKTHPSDHSFVEKKVRIFDPGGGVALLSGSRERDRWQTPHFDQKMGIQTIQNALKFPVHTIVSNEGVEEDDMIERFTNLTSAKNLASTLRTRSMLGGALMQAKTLRRP